MKRVLIGLTCFIAVAAATSASAYNCNTSAAIVNSFIKNRLSSDQVLNFNKPYWQAKRLNIFGNGTYTMCECAPVVLAGSSFMHDVKSGAVSVGERGWLDKQDSVDVCDQYTLSAEINGEPVDVLDSGTIKWENVIFDPDGGLATNWTNVTAWGQPADWPGTGCDWHFETRPPGLANADLWKVRDSNESCWGRTHGVDLSNLPVGVHTVHTVYANADGNGPAHATGNTWDRTWTIEVVECP